jgi:hypothetical protein
MHSIFYSKRIEFAIHVFSLLLLYIPPHAMSFIVGRVSMGQP